MVRTKRLALAIGSVMGLGAGFSGAAHAHAYALSYNDVMNFSLSGPSALTATATTSADSATHTAAGPGVANSDAMDALQAFATHTGDLAPGENSFSPVGMVGDYARGDAWIQNADILGGTAMASNIAETYVVHDGDLGEADARNVLSAQFSLDTDSDVSFSFDADPYMEANLGDHVGPGAKAQSELSFVMTITDLATDQVAYEFTPDDMNHAISALTAGDAIVWDPTGDGMGGTFNTYGDTVNLAAGSYGLDISMIETVSGLHTESTQVPEPGTLLLLGGGLAGIAAGARRRRKDAVA